MDRNGRALRQLQSALRSLSARRAWIEMQVFQRIAKPFRVALRKESVDRNTNFINALRFIYVSLSARRAWIEMFSAAGAATGATSRSPQGERG